MITTIIIDDEQHARELIKAYLKSYDDITVISECINGFEGIRDIQALKPDLVFLDIQMPRITGFEMLELLDNPPEVIFSTAYDNYAIQAFEQNAIDYLLKPFSAKRFDEAIQKVRQRLQNRDPAEKEGYKKLSQNYAAQLDRMAIRNGTNITIIPIEKIAYIEAQDDYVCIISHGKKYLKQYTMKYLEQALPEEFLRIHRSYIVNLDHINRIEAVTKDSYLAILHDGANVPVSRSGYNKLKETLGI